MKLGLTNALWWILHSLRGKIIMRFGSKYDKILIGQITAVDAELNRVNVIIPEITDEMIVPLSFPFVSSMSGIKFMPRSGDQVLLGFSSHIEPRILGYVLDANLDKINKEMNTKGLNFYRTLDPGDVLIYGGRGETELFLSNDGFLQLGSGVNSIKLDTLRRCIEAYCGTFELNTYNGVTAVGGTVQRTMPGSTIPQTIPGMVEFGFTIQGLTGKLVEMKAGNVVDDLGIPEAGDTGLKAFSLKVYAGVVPIGELYFDGLTMGVTAPNLDLDCGLIKLGGVLAVSPAVLGTPLAALLNSILANMVSLCGAVMPKDSSGATTIALVTAQLTSLIGQIPTILSEAVVLR